MKKKRYTAEQIVRILQEAEKSETTIGDLCQRYEVSEATYYRWRRVYGDMKVPEIRRLRDLEQENGRLKRIVADRDLEIEAMKEVLSKKR
jgi:putative transposase